MTEPILIPCEGSGCPPAGGVVGPLSLYGLCSMCGEVLPTYEDTDNITPHLRDDILARIERGDFT